MVITEINRSGYNAYWLHNSGKEVPVGKTHIIELINQPKTFNTTKDIIKATYDSYDEKINVEGKARRELILKAISDGWIRLRKRIRSGDWYCNVPDFSSKTIKSLQNWMSDMIADGEAYKTTELIATIGTGETNDPVKTMKKFTFENKSKKVHIYRCTFDDFINMNESKSYLKSILKEIIY